MHRTTSSRCDRPPRFLLAITKREPRVAREKRRIGALLTRRSAIKRDAPAHCSRLGSKESPLSARSLERFRASSFWRGVFGTEKGAGDTVLLVPSRPLASPSVDSLTLLPPFFASVIDSESPPPPLSFSRWHLSVNVSSIPTNEYKFFKNTGHVLLLSLLLS